MSVESSLVYKGDLRCELNHGPSGTRLDTDAPTDNAGRGEAFSPTDLVAAALLSCAVTTVAIVGAREGIAVGEMSGRVVKEMHPSPRRIGKLRVSIRLPDGLSGAERSRLEAIARTCPVALSLAESVAVEMSFE